MLTTCVHVYLGVGAFGRPRLAFWLGLHTLEVVAERVVAQQLHQVLMGGIGGAHRFMLKGIGCSNGGLPELYIRASHSRNLHMAHILPTLHYLCPKLTSAKKPL